MLSQKITDLYKTQTFKLKPSVQLTGVVVLLRMIIIARSKGQKNSLNSRTDFRRKY